MGARQRAPALQRPGPRLLAGALGGLLAGVVFIALTSWYVTTQGAPPLSPFPLIASMAALAPAQIPAMWLGMAIHAALSVVFGMIFAAFTVMVRGNGMLMVSGFLFGGILYAINFQVFARFVDAFSAFRGANQPFELAVHLVYGGVLAIFLLHPPRRVAPREPAAREEVPRVPTSSA